MNWKNVHLVYKKEIQGAIRDRRTLISMIVIPLIFYPLLFLGIGYFTVIGQKSTENLPSQINITGAGNSPQLVEILQKDKNIKIIQSEENPENELLGGKVHLTIHIPEVIETDYSEKDSINSISIIMKYDSTTQRSQLARKRVTVLIDYYRQQIMQARLKQIGFDADFLQPFQEQWLDLAPEERKVGSMLGSILPYIIIILIFIGAMHSAVDITAGEKERGTLATLLVSQISRLEIVLGKYFTVMSISAVSMILGLTGLSIAFLTPAYMLGEVSIIRVPFSFSLFFLFLLILTPLVGLASAILILIGIFARNSREASTYVTPIYMIAIFLGMISLSQGIELAKQLFFIPILNNSFVFKELLMGTVNWTHISATLISNISIALLALAAATNMFHRENVLFRS
ncbi:MAG: ABC transporter permease [Atribacterota bacterium]|nr:ABC transporter permease [Atribacterota bacterium]MDD4896135.1 ABC transporter permease [Atribacterota bacterium]MDD5636928.1 ABC transporter permease [Atribacterota bacterium]